MAIRMALKRGSIFSLSHGRIYLFCLILYEKRQLLKDKKHVNEKEKELYPFTNIYIQCMYILYNDFFVHV